MRGQRNRAQMKEENKTPEKELNKITNLSDEEFKTLVIRCSKNSLSTGKKKKKAGRNEGYIK